MSFRAFALSLFFLLTFALSACGPKPLSSPNSSEGLKDPADPIAGPVDPPQQPVTRPVAPLEICSKLDFANITWASRFQSADRNAFALALNISGSYEGHAGWANLTNNFDGQGLSMGLLNQTLGTGSLQPLLHKFRKNYPSSYNTVLTGSLRTAMTAMLDQWAKTKGVAAIIASLSPLRLLAAPSDVEPDREWVGKADGDIDKAYALINDFKQHGLAETQSVNWALANLYTSSTGRTFKSEWKTALQKLSAHPDYVTLQVEAAEHLHDRALGYTDRLGFTELRAYLMLFDIAVQNGSLATSHFNSYFDWLRRNPNSTEQQRQLQLIEIRVASSKPQYQEDVRRRKRTIILGTGLVHGANRNLPSEFCYAPTAKYPLSNSLP